MKSQREGGEKSKKNGEKSREGAEKSSRSGEKSKEGCEKSRKGCFSLIFRRSCGFFVEVVAFSSKWCFCSLIFRRSGGFFVDFSSKWWFFH